ncbi:MAG: TIGR04282 family arsenosugar biosynthesis glycosyltransferase [Flavobacteriaceae bacterium]|nr:TIGR04282 family arsenosugar biosynthesis glycosyltransferase [Flavobacteriaceae bacterium]
MDKNLLIIFAKNSILGKAKTRLAASIGEKKALVIYKKLIEKTANIIGELSIEKELYYSDFIEKNDVWNNKVTRKKTQRGKSLGERMENAFKNGFAEGYKNIVIIGTDLWDLEALEIEKAFVSLEKNEGVIGPAQDGGYYLLGLSKWNPTVFQNKKWGTSTVLKETLACFDKKVVDNLKTKNDIDTIEDLRAFPDLIKFIE